MANHTRNRTAVGFSPWAVSFLLWTALAAPLPAEQGVLRLSLVDPEDRPIPGVTLTCQGPGGTSPMTTPSGKTRLRLAGGTQPGDWLTLRVIEAGDENSWVFISPWNGRVLVPPFEEKAANYLALVLAKRSDRALLEDSQALTAITASIIDQVQRKSRSFDKITQEQRQRILQEQADHYGLLSEDVDEAIRNWMDRTQDPYERGLAAFYTENYPEAENQLRESLATREGELKTAMEAVVDAAFFLGQSLHQQGKYRQAAAALLRAKALAPREGRILTALGDAYHRAGEHQKASRALEKGLEYRREQLGQLHPEVADSLRSLASLYTTLGRFEEAEQIHLQVLDLRTAANGPNLTDNQSPPHDQSPPSSQSSLEIAADLSELAVVYIYQGRFQESQQTLLRALAIREQALGRQHPDVAEILDLLGVTYRKQGQAEEAETAFLRALAIREASQGLEHPSVATTLHELAVLYRVTGQPEDAEPLLQRCLAIFEKTLGPRHKETATALVSLGVHRLQQEMYGEAEALLLRAIAIHEEIFGPDHPDVGMDSFHLASVYLYQLRYSEAEATLLRVMDIDSKTLPAGHPDRAYALRSLATVFQGQDRLPEAAELLERAIDIDVAALGAEHQRIQLNLALLGEVRAQMPEPEAAQTIYQRLVSLVEKQEAPVHPKVASSLQTYIAHLQSSHRDLEAQTVSSLLRRRSDSQP